MLSFARIGNRIVDWRADIVLLRVRVHKICDNDIGCDDVFVIRDSSGSMASISGAQ